jgi:hypothetical protein
MKVLQIKCQMVQSFKAIDVSDAASAKAKNNFTKLNTYLRMKTRIIVKYREIRMLLNRVTTMVILTSHVFIGYIILLERQYENMIIVFQIVINNGFICRKSYRLLKRHHNSSLSAISQTANNTRRSCFDVTTIFNLPLSRRQICQGTGESNIKAFPFTKLLL